MKFELITFGFFFLLQSIEILSLNIIPEISQFIQGEHGKDAGHDGQTINIVLTGIVCVLEIFGHNVETIQDASFECFNWSRALDERIAQVRLSRTVSI